MCSLSHLIFSQRYKTMKITIRLSILCLLILLLTGCPEETIIVDPAQEWNAEFTIKNETSQGVSLIFKSCEKTQECWEIMQDSQKEELKAGERRTVVFQMIAVLTIRATLSFLAEVGGKTYIGWEKEALVDRQPQPAAPLQPAPVQDRLGYFHLENESATWHGPQAPRTPPPQGSPPTARYTVTITDGPDGTPQAEFMLVELSY